MPSPDTNVDLVTGAFSYTGAHIAQRLLDRGREVRTLTFHPERQHPLRECVAALPYRFDDPVALARSLQGVSTLYNTYWVRFDHGSASFDAAIANSRALFHAARRAGVRRIVHVSIANPSTNSPLPYYRGKALVEHALAESGVSFAVVRPTWIFGGQHEILANNIAWILRHIPLFAVAGDGRYPVQPVHIDDLAEICLDAADAPADVILDAAGPETLAFIELVHAVRRVTGSHSPVLRVPAPLISLAARLLGLILGDVVLTPQEIQGLTSGLLVSHDPARGRIAFTDWLQSQRGSLGRSYANELRRHFTPAGTP